MINNLKRFLKYWSYQARFSRIIANWEKQHPGGVSPWIACVAPMPFTMIPLAGIPIYICISTGYYWPLFLVGSIIGAFFLVGLSLLAIQAVFVLGDSLVRGVFKVCLKIGTDRDN